MGSGRYSVITSILANLRLQFQLPSKAQLRYLYLSQMFLNLPQVYQSFSKHPQLNHVDATFLIVLISQECLLPIRLSFSFDQIQVCYSNQTSLFCELTILNLLHLIFLAFSELIVMIMAMSLAKCHQLSRLCRQTPSLQEQPIPRILSLCLNLAFLFSFWHHFLARHLQTLSHLHHLCFCQQSTIIYLQ